MIIPAIQQQSALSHFFIYTAADTIYFDKFAKPLIKSVLANTPNVGIHVHIYNPKPDQLDFCHQYKISNTFEILNFDAFEEVRNSWLKRTAFSNFRQSQMFEKGQTFESKLFLDLLYKTYYACARFIRLAEIIRPGQQCLAIDVDGLVRGPFAHQLGDFDVYLHEFEKGKHEAGALLLNGTAGAFDFLQQYGQALRWAIGDDDLYWFLDQVILDQVVTKYKKGQLPISYIDWTMDTVNPIWSARGERKKSEVFIREQSKYS